MPDDLIGVRGLFEEETPVVADFSLLVYQSVLSRCGMVPTGVLWQCCMHGFRECHLANPVIPHLPFELRGVGCS